MVRLFYGLGMCLTVFVMTTSCATTQSRYVVLGEKCPPKPEEREVQVFHSGVPERPFVKVSRLDVHLEKTHFIGSNLNDALPELKKQARLSGADAIIEIEEHFSRVGETRIFHVTATGIRYTDGSNK